MHSISITLRPKQHREILKKLKKYVWKKTGNNIESFASLNDINKLGRFQQRPFVWKFVYGLALLKTSSRFRL